MDKEYNVFISFKNSDEMNNKTKDSELAERYYHYLTERGIDVFFSNIELEFIGKAQYSKVIDAALDSTRLLIVVGCSTENLDSQWVRYEWESFLHDIRSGIKPDGEVFVLYQDMSIKDFPRALRQQQAFDASKEESFEKLYNYIKSIVPAKNIVEKTEVAETTEVVKAEPVVKETQQAEPTERNDSPAKSRNFLLVAAGVFGVLALIVVVIFMVSMLRTPNELSAAQIFEYHVDAIFSLYAREDGEDEFIGSGFFVSSTGVAITNHHVMVNIPYAVARTHDGEMFYVVGFFSYDVENDLAVIQIDGEGAIFPYLTIGDSEAIRVGENIYAIGNNRGEHSIFSPSVVSREVPSMSFLRSMGYGFSFEYTVTNAIEFSSASNTGNSVLFNSFGNVIGITSGDAERQGVAYAVRSSHMDLSETEDYSPLPIRTPILQMEDRIYPHERFPFIPDFQVANPEAILVRGGAADDMDMSDVIMFDYMFLYSVRDGFVPSAYGALLAEYGFVFQHAVSHGDFVMFHYFHADERVRVVYFLLQDGTFMAVGVVTDAAEFFEHLATSQLVGGLWTSRVFDMAFFDNHTGVGLVYEDDGTFIVQREFTWLSGDGFIRFVSGPHEGEQWRYEIIGTTLRFTAEDGDSLGSLIRTPYTSALVGGRWINRSGAESITYSEDRTGVFRSYNADGEYQGGFAFEWVAEDGRMTYLTGNLSGTAWDYVIAGAELTFTGSTGIIRYNRDWRRVLE